MALTRDQEKTVKQEFKDYNGRLTSGQRGILEDINMGYRENKGKAYFTYDGRTSSVPITQRKKIKKRVSKLILKLAR